MGFPSSFLHLKRQKSIPNIGFKKKLPFQFKRQFGYPFISASSHDQEFDPRLPPWSSSAGPPDLPGDERHNICIDIETRAGTRHIVGDDHIQVFAHQLILSMRRSHHWFPPQNRRIPDLPLFTSERRSHIGIFNQRKGHRLPALLFNLLRRNFLCAIIRRRGSLNQNVLLFYKRARFVQQLLRRRKRYKLYALWGTESKPARSAA